ncbi:MAG TPA: two-component regulator propeller domain-containing protein [Ignavibacteriaceae bacterium]|nr:two-component regulator propeller domain-containing protein [Ignavibacteriaceae bacterium]
MQLKVIFIVILAISISSPQTDSWLSYTDTKSVTALADAGDFLWVGTRGGLVKYQKYTGEITLFNSSNSELKTNHITTVTLSNDKSIWVGTLNGEVYNYDGSNWVYFDSTNSILTGHSITQIISEPSQKLWITTWGGGLFEKQGNNWKNYHRLNSGMTDNHINCMVVISEILRYFCPYEKELLRFSNTPFGPDWSTSQAGPYSTNATAIIVDNANNLWVGTTGHIRSINLANLNEKNNFVSPLKAEIMCLAKDNNNSIWSGTFGKGIGVFKDSVWTTYTDTNSGLQGKYISSIVIDSNNTKWIGTYDAGLIKFEDLNWEKINTTTSGFNSYRITAMVVDSNNTKWFGTAGGGLLKFSNDIWTNFNISNSGLNGDFITSLKVDHQNNLWIGTYFDGINMFDGISWVGFKTTNSELPSNNISSLDVDATGSIWIGTWGEGLLKYDNNLWTVYNSNNSNLSDDYVYTIYADFAGNVWVGSYGSGIFKFNGINWENINTANSGLSNNFIQKITSDNMNRIYIGTVGGGINILENGTFLNFNSASVNLPIDQINDLLIDSHGDLWIATQLGGLIRYSSSDSSGELWHKYDNYNSGIFSNNVLKLMNDKSDNIWCGFNEGISLYNRHPLSVDRDFYNELLNDYHLYQNYPNPFNNSTRISFDLPQSAEVLLSIFDALGRKVFSFGKKQYSAGMHTVEFEADKLSSGIYFYTLVVNNFVKTQKMVLLK